MTATALLDASGNPIAGDAPDLVLPPSQTPITSEKKIRRLRSRVATVGFVDDNITGLANAMLVQYGPMATAIRELMTRQMIVEDFVFGEITKEEAQARIMASTKAPDPAPAPDITPSDPE